MSSDDAELDVTRAADLAARIDEVAAGQTWMHFVRAMDVHLQNDENVADADFPSGLDSLSEAALLAFSYSVRFADGTKPRFQLGPRQTTEDSRWPPAPDSVAPEVAAGWAVLADVVKAHAPKARLHAAAFVRGGAERARHAVAAADSYTAAAAEATRPAEVVEYLTAALRLSRAVGDAGRVQAAVSGLLAFVDATLAGHGGLGFAIQALEVAAAERLDDVRVEALANQISIGSAQLAIADRAFKVRLRLVGEADKPSVWRQRVERHHNEAAAATEPAIRSFKLRQALQVAQDSGLPDLREKISAELQACSKEDLGLIHFRAASELYREEVDDLVEVMVRGDSWQASLVQFARFGPLSGNETKNRQLIAEQHALFPLARLFPTEILGPDMLPSYSGVTAEDRFEVDLVRWENHLILGHLQVIAEALHDIAIRHGVPPLGELHQFLSSWPGMDSPTTDVLAFALHRFWSGDSDGATYTALPQIEGQIRRLIMAQNLGIYKAQRDKVRGQMPGLGVLLPLLARTHGMPADWIRYYDAALVNTAGVNLRNLVMHGFHGIAMAESAALVLHLLLHIGTLEPLAEQDYAANE